MQTYLRKVCEVCEDVWMNLRRIQLTLRVQRGEVRFGSIEERSEHVCSMQFRL